MKQKILLLGTDWLFGDKLQNVLKREFSVVGIYGKGNRRSGKKMELYHIKRILALAQAESVEHIIFDSEIILDYLENYAEENIISWLSYMSDACVRHRIHLVYLYVKKPWEALTKEYEKGLIAKYQSVNVSIVERIEGKAENSLIFEMDTVYGVGEQAGGFGGNNPEEEQALLYGLLHDANVRPVLADQAALSIIDKMEGAGRYSMQETDVDYGMEVERHQEKCAFKLIYQLEAPDYCFGKNIAALRISLGKMLARAIPADVREKIDIVCPVPRTGMYYAMGLAEAISKQYVQALIKTRQEERSFQIANTDARKLFLWSKMKAIPELLKGKSVAVVDEAIFTGTTLKVVCEILWECGVKEIYLCIPTPRCRYHCDYLVHPPRPMLLEYIKEDMLEEYFNVSGVYFQRDEDFKEELNRIDKNMCAECFWGKEV